MAITLCLNMDITSVAAATAETVCLFACALIALWWGNSKTHADLRFHRGNSKTPKLVLAAEIGVVSPPNSKTQRQDPEAGVDSPPKCDSPQFTSVYDLALWRLHSQADQPADEPAHEVAPEPIAAETGMVSPPNSKTQQQDPEAWVDSPPKRDSPQFTSVYDLALWRLHSQTDQPADEPAHEVASEPIAAETGMVSPPNSKTQQQDPEAWVDSPPKRDSPQFTSVYDLALWRLHSQADQPADEPDHEVAPEPKADVGSEKLPPWPCPKPPASPSQGDPGLDVHALLGSPEQHWDLALDGLCEQAVVEQGTSVPMDLERDREAFSDGGFPTRQVDTELPRDVVPEPEEEQDRAYEDLCDSALVALELDMELLRDVVPEPEQLDGRQSCASQTAAGAAREDRIADILQEHARFIQKVHKTFAEYMLWII